MWDWSLVAVPLTDIRASSLSTRSSGKTASRLCDLRFEDCSEVVLKQGNKDGRYRGARFVSVLVVRVKDGYVVGYRLIKVFGFPFT
jgi:hypothetical protein